MAAAVYAQITAVTSYAPPRYFLVDICWSSDAESRLRNEAGAYLRHAEDFSWNRGRDDCLVNALNQTNAALFKYYDAGFGVFGPMTSKIYYEHEAVAQRSKEESRPAKQFKFHENAKADPGLLYLQHMINGFRV